MDVSSLDDWNSMINLAVEKYGHVDILVNNAGTTYRNKPSEQVTIEEFQRVFDVNVKSIFLASQTFIPKLIEQGKGGSMINVSSTGAQRPRPGLVWYNASKGAVSNVCFKLRALLGYLLLWMGETTDQEDLGIVLIDFHRPPKVLPPSMVNIRSASTTSARSSPALVFSRCLSACQTPLRTELNSSPMFLWAD